MSESDVKELLEDLHIGSVAVFDDHYYDSKTWYRHDDHWQGIFEAYPIRIEEAFGPVLANDYRNLPSSEREAVLPRLAEVLGVDLEAFKNNRDDMLERWISQMQNWGLEVHPYHDWDAFRETCRSEPGREAVDRFGLIILDHDFGEELGNAQHSETIASDIARALKASASSYTPITAPILLKFSVADQGSESQKISFTRKSEFPRGCYEFIAKDALDRDDFSLIFARVMHEAKLGRYLYDAYVRISSTIASASASSIMEALFQMDPQSIRILSTRALQPEGISGLDYFFDLILGLLRPSIAGSTPIAEAIVGLLNVVNEDQDPGQSFTHYGISHVQNAVLFDPTVNSFQRPIGFGDIFRFESPDRVGFLVAQDCDLVVRDRGSESPRSATSQVALLCGSIVDDPGSGADTTRYFKAPGATDEEMSTSLAEYRAIDWDFRNLLVVPRGFLDLVSLSPDGAALLPAEGIDPECKWWPEVYARYVKTCCDDLRKSLVAVSLADGEQFDALRAGTDPHTSKTLACSILLVGERSPGGHRFPIRRLARLRWSEVLKLQQKYLSQAGRIGLPVVMQHNKSHTRVSLLRRSNGQVIKELSAVAYDDDKKKGKVFAVQVQVAAFVESCLGEPGYEDLLHAVKDRYGEFDLYSIVHEERLRSKFEWSRQDGAFRLRPK